MPSESEEIYSLEETSRIGFVILGIPWYRSEFLPSESVYLPHRLYKVRTTLGSGFKKCWSSICILSSKLLFHK